MIILNTKIDHAQKQNEQRLKQTMSEIIVREAPPPTKHTVSKQLGGKINPIDRRELPVIYTNTSSAKPKKIKTFALTI